MSDEPKYEWVEYSVGYSTTKVEGEGIWFDGVKWQGLSEPRRPVWIARVTEWPRRKTARALQRLADWICYDRDEGW